MNRMFLLQDFRETLEKQITDMLPVCMQPLTVSRKCDVLEKKVVLRLGLAQVVPLSPILFFVYSNDLQKCSDRIVGNETTQSELGKDEVTLTADDVVLHTNDWTKLQRWLDACA